MAPQQGFLAAIGSFAGVAFRGLRDRRWARWTLNSVVFAAVGISLAGRAQTSQQPIAHSPVSPVLAQPQPDINVIVAANLLGVYGDSAGKSGAMARNSLNVVVTGLLAFGSIGSMATMSVDGKPETSFVTGEEILPGVRLHAVETERVILSRNGLLETVPLKEFADSGSASPAIVSVGGTLAMPSTSLRDGQHGFTRLAESTATPGHQTAAPQDAAPARPGNGRRNRKNGGGPGAAAGGWPDPQPGDDSDRTISRLLKKSERLSLRGAVGDEAISKSLIS